MSGTVAPFASVFAACLALTVGCGSDGLPPTPSGGGASSTGGSASGGQPNPSAGASGSNTAPGGAAAGGSSGAGAGAGAGAAGASPSGGAAGASGASTGGGSNGGSSAGGSAGAGGAGPVNLPHGKSAGCGKPPPGIDSESKSILHEVKITTPLDPVWLGPNGTEYKKNFDAGAWGPYDYTHRPYSVRLPKGYDPTKGYAITMGGGGCGGSATGFASGPGNGYQPDNSNSTIQIGLSYLAGCFDDGGPGIDLRTDTPEIPYLRAVIADVEANLCVDQSLVFISGTSSGGWETYTGGCAAADTIRAIGAVSGGLRLHRPACTGPQASMMVEGKSDNENPIGPITPPVQRLDSPGSAPARDEILKRNGCVAADFQFTYTDINGNAPHVAWDAAYPECVTYTGCPKETPVVWCALNGGHQVDNEGQVSYKAAIYKFWSSLPSRP